MTKESLDPQMLALDTPLVMYRVTWSDLASGPLLVEAEGGGGVSVPEGPFPAVPGHYLAVCYPRVHPAGTFGSPPEGGFWLGTPDDDFWVAWGQAVEHNQAMLEVLGDHVEAYVTVRVGNMWVGPVNPL